MPQGAFHALPWLIRWKLKTLYDWSPIMDKFVTSWWIKFSTKNENYTIHCLAYEVLHTVCDIFFLSYFFFGVCSMLGHTRQCAGLTPECIKKSLLVVLRGSYAVLIVEHMSVMCKANTLPTVPSCQPHLSYFFLYPLPKLCQPLLSRSSVLAIWNTSHHSPLALFLFWHQSPSRSSSNSNLLWSLPRWKWWALSFLYCLPSRHPPCCYYRLKISVTPAHITMLGM